ncbi:hypothetical protein AVEN_229477-1 [Araneus ventricosus]|uniref:Uncharacterized protein n=1 Tax=Araneus ventricosus TaxID=182803 RepID=A0A4Y2IXV7_ARAVE|nr:hypothetical protein AVEN_229477-1 [Araneus ventricosus]
MDTSPSKSSTVTKQGLHLCDQNTNTYAYADDLALVVSASSRKILEENVSSFLDVLKNFLEDLNLQIASEKTLAVVFRGNQNKYRQKRGLASLKRPPIFKIGGRTIRTVDSLKYLGPNWGTGVSLLKHWYLSVIQPSLLYRAAVWGGSFTQKQINTLHSIQRVALVKISKSFRTCPTNALNVFLGLPPLHVVANSLFIKFKICYARSNNYDFINTNNLDFYIKVNSLDLNLRLIEFPNYILDADFDVYTDGSGIDGNIGASAELAAVNFAAGWALDNNYKINIFTDSFSSIEVLKSHGKSLPSNAGLMVGKRVLQGEAWSSLSDSRGTHDLGDKLGDLGDK